jgi:Ca-activated chloride channel family protein
MTRASLARTTIALALFAALPLTAATGSLARMNNRGEIVGECPLKHTDVKAEISGFLARVTVTQEFENTSHEKIEAVYTFPLSAKSAVDDMTMLVGDRTIKGVIKKREEARAITRPPVTKDRWLRCSTRKGRISSVGGEHRPRRQGEDRDQLRRTVAIRPGNVRLPLPYGGGPPLHARPAHRAAGWWLVSRHASSAGCLAHLSQRDTARNPRRA